MPLPEQFEFLVANFVDTAAITTSMVGSVNQFKASNPEYYKEVISGINSENLKSLNALRKINSNSATEKDYDSFRISFEASRKMTKKLGELSNVAIEPDDATALIEKSLTRGAFVSKLPGAGGYDSIVALVRSREDLKNLKKFWSEQKSLQLLNVEKNSSGFEIIKSKNKVAL
jgi:phosphomevalonate kinase